MKANELRINNSVLLHGDIMHIDATDILVFSQGKLLFEPIPLTEEWLLKFGFEKRDSSTCVQWWNGINEVTHDWLVDLTWLKEPERIGAPNAPFYRKWKTYNPIRPPTQKPILCFDG